MVLTSSNWVTNRSFPVMILRYAMGFVVMVVHRSKGSRIAMPEGSMMVMMVVIVMVVMVTVMEGFVQ